MYFNQSLSNPHRQLSIEKDTIVYAIGSFSNTHLGAESAIVQKTPHHNVPPMILLSLLSNSFLLLPFTSPISVSKDTLEAEPLSPVLMMSPHNGTTPPHLRVSKRNMFGIQVSYVLQNVYFDREDYPDEDLYYDPIVNNSKPTIIPHGGVSIRKRAN